MLSLPAVPRGAGTGQDGSNGHTEALTARGRLPQRQQGLCSVHTTFFCSSAMARRTQPSRTSKSLQASGARLLYRQGALSSSPSSCLAASRSCSSEVPSRCRPFLVTDGLQGRARSPGFPGDQRHSPCPDTPGCRRGPIEGTS